MAGNAMSQHERGVDQVKAAWPMFVLFLLLGVAVFCWGLGDKLSLYATVHGAHPTAKAKLLTEQATTKALASVQADPYVTPHAEPTHTNGFSLVLAIVLSVGMAGHSRTELHDGDIRLSRRVSFLLVSVRRRPPPVIGRAFLGVEPVLSAVLA